jgi:hypothetical protein
MNAPGTRLRAICIRVFAATTMARLIDPVLSDLQAEYCEARRQGRVWRSRWIRAAGYVAFAHALVAHGADRTTQMLRDWPADDRRTLWRTIGFAAAGMIAVTTLLVGPAFRSYLHGLAFYVVPQALPLAIPPGVTLGLFCGLAGRPLSSRLRATVLAMALACAAVSFVTMAWITPVSNQMFSAAITARTRATKPDYVGPPKFPTDLTLGELRQQVDAYARAGRQIGARSLGVDYYLRWALPCGVFVLALFALSVRPRRPVRTWLMAPAALGVAFAYVYLLMISTGAGRNGTLPVVVAAWLPNLAFAAAAAASALRATAHREPLSAHDDAPR